MHYLIHSLVAEEVQVFWYALWQVQSLLDEHCFLRQGIYCLFIIWDLSETMGLLDDTKF
jgi:hypothetical protein